MSPPDSCQLTARALAELIGAHPLDVVFTSCATESNNAAIAAALRATGILPVKGQSQTRAGSPCHAKRHIVTSQVEHSSVLNYCMALERGGLDRSGGFTPPSVATGLPRHLLAGYPSLWFSDLERKRRVPMALGGDQFTAVRASQEPLEPLIEWSSLGPNDPAWEFLERMGFLL